MKQPAAPQLATGTSQTLRTQLGKRSWRTAALAVFVGSCSAPDADKPLPQAPAAVQQTNSAAADACLARTKGLLRWYYRYYDRNDTSTRFINFPLTAADDSASVANEMRGNISATPYMQLNRRKLAVYLATLRRSGYFSAHYLAALRASIVQRGRDLEEAKQADGVPEGFDADEVMLGQDIYQLTDIDKLAAYQPANRKPSTLAYRLHLPSECKDCPDFSWYFYLKNENGRCVVDSVKTSL